MDLDKSKVTIRAVPKAYANPMLNGNENTAVSEIPIIRKCKEKRDKLILQKLQLQLAKEKFEQLLTEDARICSSSKFSECEKLFGQMEFWKLIPKSDLHEIYSKYISTLVKFEMEEAERVKKRNTRALNKCFKDLKLTNKSTWIKAEEMLRKYPKFLKDKLLVKMNKEDMLEVFMTFIFEEEFNEILFKLWVAKSVKRQERKNREHFQIVLENLHGNGKIHSKTLWKDVQDDICKTIEFQVLLRQSGSTPLDLFKFFVLDLLQKEKLETSHKKILDVVETKLNSPTIEGKVACSTPHALKMQIVKKDSKRISMNKFVNCKDCSFKTKLEKDLISHCKIKHSKIIPLEKDRSAAKKKVRALGFKCLKCNLECDSYKTLKDHLKSEFENVKIRCFQCNKTICKNQFNNHIITHFEKVKCVIKNCNDKFTTTTKYKNHLEKMHKDIEKKVIDDLNDRMLHMKPNFDLMRYV